MAEATVELRNVEGTEAALGWSAGHTIVVDRTEGTAGGKGLGFNGAQLLAFSIGGCFCNDLRYVAHAMDVALGAIAVSVTVQMEGDPLITTAAEMRVDLQTLDGTDPASVIAEAQRITMVSNSLSRGFPVAIRPAS